MNSRKQALRWLISFICKKQTHCWTNFRKGKRKLWWAAFWSAGIHNFFKFWNMLSCCTFRRRQVNMTYNKADCSTQLTFAGTRMWRVIRIKSMCLFLEAISRIRKLPAPYIWRNTCIYKYIYIYIYTLYIFIYIYIYIVTSNIRNVYQYMYMYLHKYIHK